MGSAIRTGFYDPVADGDKGSAAWGNAVEDRIMGLEKTIDAVIGTGGDYPAGSGGLQSAIDDFPDGFHFLLTRETHSLTSPVNLKLNSASADTACIIEGMGWGTILDLDFSQNSNVGGLQHTFTATSLNTLILKNFAMTGYGSKNACIFLDGAGYSYHRWRLQNLYLHGAGDGGAGNQNAHGAHLINCISGTIDQCEMYNNVGYGLKMDFTAPVAGGAACNAVTVVGGRYNENGVDGIINDYGAGTHFYGVIAESNGAYGIHLRGTRNNGVYGGYMEGHTSGAAIFVERLVADTTQNAKGNVIINPYFGGETIGIRLGNGANYTVVAQPFGNSATDVQLDSGASLNTIHMLGTDTLTDNSGSTNWIWQENAGGDDAGLIGADLNLNSADATAGNTTVDSRGLLLRGRRWTGTASEATTAQILMKILSATQYDNAVEIQNPSGNTILRMYNYQHATNPAMVQLGGSVVPSTFKLNLNTARITDVKHLTADPAVGDLDDGDIVTGLVAGTAKIYFKKGSTIYVFNHAATIT